MPFLYWNYLYYFVIPLQIICILHALRTGRREWLYLLFFLPLAGAIVYIIREIIPSFRGGQTNQLASLFAGNRVKELERRRRLADTDAVRLELSAEYARQGNYERALELTKSCLVGIYANNAGMMRDMARYSFGAKKYTDAISWYDKAASAAGAVSISLPEDELIYARALQEGGDKEKAEAQFLRIIRMHHLMEAKYNYGMMLAAAGRVDEARNQFQSVLDERDLHPRHVRRRNAEWIRSCRRELNKMK